MKFSPELEAARVLLRQGYNVDLTPALAKELARILDDYREALRQLVYHRGD